MELVYCKISSADFGIEEFIITDEVTTDIDNFIYYDRDLPKSVIEAILNKNVTFSCNNYEYTIVESELYNKSFFINKSETEVITEKDIIRKVNVYKVKCHCLKCENKYGYNSIEYKMAVFMTALRKKVKIELSFCKHCGEYYIDSKSLEEYEKEYGILLCMRVFSKEFDDLYKNNLFYGAPSVLTLYGYNARITGPESTERQHIIRYLIENGIAEKHEIKEILSNLIEGREHRFPDAAVKWREDLIFTNNLDVGQKRIEGVFEFICK